jgi:uncharacterized protein (DUF58 family)
MPQAGQLTSLLSNSALARLERMRVNPRKRQTNLGRGEHLARKGGTSTEFTDYRDYSAGDDVRYVDWNIFSRLNRPYLKLYRHEEEMHVVVLIDGSTSMVFADKFLMAKRLAAAFCIVGLYGGERTSVYACHAHGQAPQFLAPMLGRPALRRALQFLENLEGGGDAMIDAAVDEVLLRHKGRGLVFVLSDFLTFGDLTRPFNRLHAAGLEPHAIQILSPEEVDPELTGDIRLVDSETGDALDISSANDLLALYHEHRQALEEDLATMCRQRGGRYLPVRSDEAVDTVLFDRLRRQGWVR